MTTPRDTAERTRMRALDQCLHEFARAAAAGESRVRVAVELRHDSWWTEDVRELLARHDAALCWADRLGHPLAPLWRTADWGYLRLHEGGGEGADTAQPWPRSPTASFAWSGDVSTRIATPANVRRWTSTGSSSSCSGSPFESWSHDERPRRWRPWGC